jgi:general secretion pathway protein K
MMHQPRRNDSGMILINVLVIVMLATAILAVMIAGDDADVELNLRLRNAAQAMAIARGAELSSVTELRRDLAEGNERDSLGEKWSNIADRSAKIDGGVFTSAVFDAQARFNINNLQRNDSLSKSNFAAIVAAAGLPAETVESVAALLQETGPISGFTDLGRMGLDLPQLIRLAPYCTVLPEPTDINLNTASQELVGILLNNPGKARVLVAARSTGKGLTRSELASTGIIPPPGTGVTSNYFWVRGHVVIGSTGQQLTSLLYRRTFAGKPQVLVLKRWRGAGPLQAPPLDFINPVRP